MGTILHAADAKDLTGLLARLDGEFIFSRGRRISLAQRFPEVYCPANLRNILVLEAGGNIVSALATRPFLWSSDAVQYKGAMIGAVYTQPEHRGEGHAGRLLSWAAQRLRDDGLDFAVLWTTQPAIYASRGWHALDRGVLGECTSAAYAACSVGLEPSRCDAATWQRIEAIRRRWSNSWVLRDGEGYRQLPLPADSTTVLVAGDDVEQGAYALAGRQDDCGFLYEMTGAPAGFPALWQQLQLGFRRLLVNDATGSPSHRWLSRSHDLAWCAKPLALWLPLSDRIAPSCFGRWYIPYIDRI